MGGLGGHGEAGEGLVEASLVLGMELSLHIINERLGEGEAKLDVLRLRWLMRRTSLDITCRLHVGLWYHDCCSSLLHVASVVVLL